MARWSPPPFAWQAWHLGGIHRPFAWQAWHLVTSTVTLAWHAWHFWDWTGSGGALGPQWTRWSPPPFAWQSWHLPSIVPLVAGVALGDIHRHFGAAAPVAWTGLVLVARLSTHTLSTHNLSQLVHTTCPHTTCRHTFVAHANPSPSLFSFPHFPSHLYLSFASYWKKLTCGVIRSFNWFLFFAAISTRIGLRVFF